MTQKIDCFLACESIAALTDTVGHLRLTPQLGKIFFIVREEILDSEIPQDCTQLVVDQMQSTNLVMQVAEHAEAPYALLCLKPAPVSFGASALERMLLVAEDADAAMVYSDRWQIEAGERKAHPVIDYQEGALRNDFDFGSLVLVRTSLLHKYAASDRERDYQWAGFYDFRLFLSREGTLFHLNEYLYTEEETDLRASGVKQFDYVNPANREVQIEMEQACTSHLRQIGALVDTNMYQEVDFEEQDFEQEASVIIPVFNRAKTIQDAVESALSQKTNFKYNVIVVDNHSTDGTGDILASLQQSHSVGDRLVVLKPERHDLGIGGCWNEAVNSVYCGRFAVQLDSDDLYSSPNTLQTIVDAFYKQRAAMMIGSYRMCDFDLNTLPPGLIDHKEWTDENGPNNALRINGLGAPRAFFTPLLRQVQFPNTSYGEDYALGLIFSRHYRIGRIYTELYLCRRWGGNSDAALSVEKVNANNLYKDRLRTIEVKARQQANRTGFKVQSSWNRFFERQLRTWDEVRQRYRDLRRVETRELVADGIPIEVQWNPARIRSTGAKIDARSLAERPCFLCVENRPKEQIHRVIDKDYELLVNPFPILPLHFTIPTLRHQPQAILPMYAEMYRLAAISSGLTILYNGPKCGASAPDHAHLQAVSSNLLPLQRSWQRLSRNMRELVKIDEEEGIYHVVDYPAVAFLIRSHSQEGNERLFKRLYHALPQSEDETEPMMNVIMWRQGEETLSVILPRKKHRPDCYTQEGDGQYLISPGAVDMGGLIITPREEDFRRMTPEIVLGVYKEVSLTPEQVDEVVQLLVNSEVAAQLSPQISAQPDVKVGIVSGQKIQFSLNAPYMAKGETIEGEQIVEFSEGGILWRGMQYRELTFTPQSPSASFSLHDVTIGVNFHWERKETQVFLGTLRLVVEADKITAINQLPVEQYLASVISSEMKATSGVEFLKAHAVISRSWLLAQMKRREENKEKRDGFFSFVKKDDELIRWYDREDHTIFDVCADDHCQRYQGITKQTNKAVELALNATRGCILCYGDEICDARFSKCCGGITEEFQYCWEDTPKPYLVSVEDPFCHTNDRAVLSQVLNDYDQETNDFYRWTVEYTMEELSRLVSENLKDDFGEIVDLIPLERGKSGRIWKLRIVGTKKTMTIGKELEIRRALSESHLYSSAFDVEKTPTGFRLHGKGWGHGVGLCQIGAAVMGQKGYKYDEILLHYYRGAEIKKIY